MEIQIVGKNVEISERVRQHVERKVSKLERHLPHIVQGVVEISRETTKSPEHRFIAQITLTHSGTILRGEEKSSDVLTAITSAVDVLDRRIERYKGMLYQRGKRHANKHEEPLQEEPEKKIVKEKQFRVEVMSPDEAVEQMELLGHDFFLFINEIAQRFSLLYRRRDGNYGLIESEIV